MKPSYAGIGNRKNIPFEDIRLMNRIGSFLAQRTILRSGGAIGADSAFEYGCDLAKGEKQIFRPDDNLPDWTEEYVKEYHPHYSKMREDVLRLMQRNVLIILGADGKSHVDNCVCYAVSEEQGGTAFGIRLIKAHHIPYQNLATENGKMFWIEALNLLNKEKQ